MNQTDILRNRLVKELQPNLQKFGAMYVGFLLWAVSLFVPDSLLRQTKETQIFFWMCLGATILLLLWLALLRWIRPESNRVRGYVCFYLNIFLCFAWPAALFFLQAYRFLFTTAILLAEWIALLMFSIQTNRLILALYRPVTRQAREMASPCPEIFRRLDFDKSMPFLPLVIAAIVGIPVQIFSGRLVGYLAGLAGVVGLLWIPILFIKQTPRPSRFQKFIRWIAKLISHTRGISRQEFPAFYWWLSHTGWDWPENFEELAPFIDTDTFDWQNPNEWTEPLRRAQEQLARQKSHSPNPPLVIGSRTDEWTDKLQAAAPHTSKITPLLAAVIHNNKREMEKLLPTEEINRAYAGNGNTPLHIAA